jgi:zinc transporter 2
VPEKEESCQHSCEALDDHHHHHLSDIKKAETEAPKINSYNQTPTKGATGSHDHNDPQSLAHVHDHTHTQCSPDHSDPPPKSTRNINVDAAFLHAMGDMIMSIGVCIAATTIYFQPTWTWADPICTVVFSIIVCVTVTPIVKNCISVLMEGSPSEIDTERLLTDIKNCGSNGEIMEIHDFHLWSISIGKYALSAHVGTTNPNYVLKEVTKLCKDKYGIDHVTLQMEDVQACNEHWFVCDQ